MIWLRVKVSGFITKNEKQYLESAAIRWLNLSCAENMWFDSEGIATIVYPSYGIILDLDSSSRVLRVIQNHNGDLN